MNTSISNGLGSEDAGALASPPQDIRSKVRSFVEKNFYVPDSFKLGDDTSLLESGIVDSTGVMEIVSFLQSDFDIDVPDLDLVPDNLDSIGKISAYIGRMNKPAPLTS